MRLFFCILGPNTYKIIENKKVDFTENKKCIDSKKEKATEKDEYEVSE